MQLEYDRITHILSPFSGLSAIPQNILNQAAQRGKIIHEICDGIIEGIGNFSFPEVNGYITSFEKWKMGKKFIKKPERLYCQDYMITGEIDGIYEGDNGLILFDLKTSHKEGATWPLQGSAYSYLLKKAGYDIRGIEFIRLSSKATDPMLYVYEDNFDLFLKCLEIYRLFFKKTKSLEVLDLV